MAAARQNSTQKLTKNESVEKVTSQTEKMSLENQEKSTTKGVTVEDGRRGSVSTEKSRRSSSSSETKIPPPSSSKGSSKEKRRQSAAESSKETKEEDDSGLEWFIDEEYLKELEKDSKPEDRQRRRELADKIKMEGNDIYTKGEFTEAARVYTEALRTLPISHCNERAILYSNRAACFLYMEEMDEGILDCSKALELNPNYLKAILRRAQLYEKKDKLDEALTDYKKVLELEPKNPRALEACARLPDEIRDRNERLKTEMLGKLKDLGNMILKPFGLSTENFKVQQDPSSGSYSINLQQNK